MLEWMARKLGLLPQLPPDQVAAEKAERRRAANESNARTLSAVAWSTSAGLVCALILWVAYAATGLQGGHKIASAALFAAMWGFGWHGWRNPDTWLRSVKRLIDRR